MNLINDDILNSAYDIYLLYTVFSRKFLSVWLCWTNIPLHCNCWKMECHYTFRAMLSH